jgi:hypothetical protein
MTPAQQILDLDRDFMQSQFSLLDLQRELVGKHMNEDFEKEGDSPLVEDWEFLHAIGFATAQKYLSASCRVLRMEKQKHTAYALGPRINSEVSCAAVVNAAANHWKHSSEWDFTNLSDEAKRTIATLNKAGVEVPEYGSYVASNVFGKLGLKKFGDLTPVLKQWAEDVEKAFPDQTLREKI